MLLAALPLAAMAAHASGPFQFTDPSDDESLLVHVPPGVLPPSTRCDAPFVDVLALQGQRSGDDLVVTLHLAGSVLQPTMVCSWGTMSGGVSHYEVELRTETELALGVQESHGVLDLRAVRNGTGLHGCARVVVDDRPSDCLGALSNGGASLTWTVPLAGTAIFEGAPVAYDLRGQSARVSAGTSFEPLVLPYVSVEDALRPDADVTL